ncbi:MAG: LamG-like jellyroll fold domain-containing protein [Candidatus Brocadiia bacterium]
MKKQTALALVVVALAIAAMPRSADGGEKKADIEKLRARLARCEEGAVADVKAASPEVRQALAPDLLQASFAYDWDTAMEARWLLVRAGRAAPDKVVPLVVEKLKNTPADQLHVRLPLVELLRDLGPAAKGALPVLTEALDSDDLTIQREAALALRAIGPDAKAAAPSLIPLLDSRDASIRNLAVSALRVIGPQPDLVPALVEALRSDYRPVRRYAVQALGELGPKAQAAVPALVELLGGDDRFLKLEAVESLGAIGPAAQKAVPALLRLAEGQSEVVLETISAALQNIKTKNQPPTAAPARASCPEGMSTELTLSATDPDDVAVALRAEIVAKPEHGTLRRTGPLAFVYHSGAGHVGEDAWTWRATDGQAHSQPAQAVVQVVPDKTPPKVTGAFAVGKEDRVIVEFSEPLDPDSARTTANYTISPDVQVKKAALAKDGQSVTLTTSPLEKGATYTLVVKNVKDRAKAANTAEPSGRNFTYHVWKRTGLLIWARAEGDARDDSDQGNHGKPSPDVAFDPHGVRGKAFKFPGATGNKKNAVSFGDIDAIDDAPAFTIALWFKRLKDRGGDSNHTVSNILVSQGSDDENDNLEIGTQGKNVEVYLDTAGTDENAACDAGIEDGKWYHLVLTYDAKRSPGACLYINGKRVKTWKLWNGPLDNSAGSPFTIGNTHHEETPFQGLIDEFFLFRRVLADEEIQALAAGP